MPVPPSDLDKRFYLGLDPGEKGALAMVDGLGKCVFLKKMPETAVGLAETVRWTRRGWLDPPSRLKMIAGIERIDPRPTTIPNPDKTSKQKWVKRILRSTCIIYGDFLQLHMAVLACDIPIEIIGAQEWQGGLSIPPRDKSKKETTSQFKSRLACIAKDMFPNDRVINQTADALLIAEYLRRKHA